MAQGYLCTRAIANSANALWQGSSVTLARLELNANTYLPIVRDRSQKFIVSTEIGMVVGEAYRR